MTTMPKHIKRNPLYRKFFQLIHQKDSGVNLAFIGRPGSGKSTAAIKVCLDMDSTFNVNRICHSVKEVLNLLVHGDPVTGKILPGQAILLDEVINEQGAYSRSALSKSNILFSYLFANFRAKRIIFCICLPKLTQLDKDIREVALHGIYRMKRIDFKNKNSIATYYWVSLNELMGTSKITMPRLFDVKTKEISKVKNIIFSAPNKDFVALYKKKKMDYIASKEEVWLKKSMEDEVKEEKKEVNRLAEQLERIREKKYDLKEKGKFNPEKIMLEFGCGINQARSLAKIAQIKIV